MDRNGYVEVDSDATPARRSSTRSSTSRCRGFSLRNVCAGTRAEPLAGRRALHNSANTGPDPDREIERATRKCRASADTFEREACRSGGPRASTLSRRDIFKKRPDVDAGRCLPERPRTLPATTAKRNPASFRAAPSSNETDFGANTRSLKRVSRQEILRRRATLEISAGRRFSAKEDGELSPRPSTLPKIVQRSKPSAGKEAPVYGRIRRREMSTTGGKSVRCLRDALPDTETRSNGISRRRIIQGLGDVDVDVDSDFDSPNGGKHRDRDQEFLRVERESACVRASSSSTRAVDSIRRDCRDDFRVARRTGLSSTLPNYATRSRQAVASAIPPRVESRGSRERGSYYVKRSTATPSRGSAGCSDSPVNSRSIFGFCTGRRKVHSRARNAEGTDQAVPFHPRWTVKTGELVWFDPGVGHVLPGEVLEYHRAANVLSVQALIAGKPQIFTLTSLSGVRPRQDLGQNGVEDMIQLTDLNEASLLWNLKIRYDKELIYTYTGSILVAVNPYKMFDIYGLDQVKLYEGRILGTLSPHLFAVGSSAYSQVTAANNASANQVVVISGESGSGKTESTKLVMQYLAAVNRAPNNLVTEQILEATPLLESFGNAKTPRNDNSSRFGKYLEVYFRDGVIVGGRITQYLLEKSRIVTQASEERNYHVFYELLAGLDQQLRDKYGLLTPDKYFYLNQGGSCEIDGKNDPRDFKALLSAMQVLGFTSEEQDTIFKILASVLHLGNVYFHRKQMRHGQEGVEVGSDAEIRWAAHLLQINADGIIRALTTKTTEARNERVLTALNIDQALDARDAFAKALYSSLFSWLVARVNHIVYKGTKQTAAISILDIFGFENFAENSFEQLCINYANENLQFYFNKHIFKLEQQEYAKEKIDWTTVNYTDNMPVIHLIAKKPVGILHLLDDESNFPKATDLSFLEKCHYNHALSELYSRPRMNSAEFAIKHYAGQVWYNVEGFLDKNRDTLRPDVVELLISSKLSMVSKMFQHVRNTHEANKTINKPNGRFVTMKPRTPTVSARFHDSLQQLLESMSRCNPWFVRCIKPNAEKAPMKFDMPCVLEQLRYTGMLETIRIRKTGYPVRLAFGHFVERYRYLVPTRLPRTAPNKELCRIILEKASPPESKTQYQLGLTRVFLRESLERSLEYNRALILERAAVTVQRYTRGFLARRRFANVSRSTILIQAIYRGYRERKKYRALKRAVLLAQTLYRGKRDRARFRVLKEEMVRRAEMERANKERAKAKQQRDEQERTSRAVAGVNHLEIPAELAFIYSKLDDWQPVHTERNLLKVVGPVIPAARTYQLPADIDQYQFSKFTNIYFKSHIFGMKREPIKTPFLAKARDQDYSDSLMIFKMILRFMNENNLSGKREQALGDYIVNKGIVNEKLRDEILCQLANQTWKNDNDGNNERGWLLLANCLSAFQPSRTLFKYLLKYVSDHAHNGYKAYCQRKLLQVERTITQQTVYHVPRNYPPCVLEWRANRNRVNMALNVGFYDGESVTCAVDSWTTCEELANQAVQNHGVENTGWTITLWNQLDGPDAIVTETNGFDYILDLIAELELAPAFPAVKNVFLEQRKNSFPPMKKREHVQIIRELEQEMDVPVLKTFQPLERKAAAAKPVENSAEVDIPAPRRPTVPPPQPPLAKPSVRKQSHEAILESTTVSGLSRKSALNDRYFDKEKQRSRSLDNLLQPEVATAPTKLANLGLSASKLNERYHSLERIGEAAGAPAAAAAAVSNAEYMTRSEITQERKYNRATRTTEPNIVEEEDLAIDFEYPDIQSVSQTGRSEDDKGSYIRSQTRFIKSQYPGKRAMPGSQSSRAYIEKSEYGVKSSAMSDTSEAPSLASHVRRVRVPSQASDVDQFLDELFMPVLDGNLDELSDARSLAASIKGSTVEEFVAGLAGSEEDAELTAKDLSRRIKGGGNMDIPNQNASFNFSPIAPSMMSPPMMMPMFGSPQQVHPAHPAQNASMNIGPGPFMPIPIYSMQGLTLPHQSSSPSGPNNDMAAYHQSLQRAFLQSAMAQNIQIQQQLLAQNQALQQLLVQSPQNAAQQQPPEGVNFATRTSLDEFRMGFSEPRGGVGLCFQGVVFPAEPFSMNLVPPAPEIAAQIGPNDSIGRSSKVSFREPENGELWSTEKQTAAGTAAGTPATPKTPKTHRQDTVTVKAQIHRAQSPVRNKGSVSKENQVRKTSLEYAVRKISVERKSPPSGGEAKKTGGNKSNVQNNFTNVLSELKSRKSSLDSNLSSSSANANANANANASKGVPPPPPPPMPPPLESHDPSESRPFLDPYGRAKTVRIGKWRWPPPSDSIENQGQDSFIEFKMRQQQQQQQQRKITPHYQEYQMNEREASPEGAVEWEEFEMENVMRSEERTMVIHAVTSSLVSRQESNGQKEEGEKKKKKSKSSLEIGAQRPSPGSIGKLKLSSEMRQRLEKVTANHSVRSSKATEKPALPREDVKVKRLEDNRKLLLEQQLGGRWEDYASTADDTQSVTSKGTTDMMTEAQVVRSQIERMERPIPPPPPVTPPQQPPTPRGGSSYSNSNGNNISQSAGVAPPKSPPAPIEPKTRADSFRISPPDSEDYEHLPKNQRDMFSQSRDIFASQQLLRAAEQQHLQEQKSKDSTEMDSTRREGSSDIFDPNYARHVFDNPKESGPARKRRESFGMPPSPPSSPSPRDFGVVANNTRESFAAARRSFRKFDEREAERRFSVASTQRTDKIERIEIEEWPEFLKPVLPPADKPEIEKAQEVRNTKLYPQTSSAHFTYNRVSWTLRVKKEIFAPNETLSSPLALHLVFCQVAYDVLATSSIRISKEDRQSMIKLLDNYGVTLDNLQSTQHKITIKKNIVDMAKQWPLYFARIFPASIGPQHPEVQHAAVSHHGLRLIKRTASGEFIILETLPLEDIVSVSSARAGAGVCVLQISSGVRLPLHTNRAAQLAEMLSKYIRLDMKMEREVSDAEAIFSRRLSSNWAELPTTLRRKEKHRADILGDFSEFSESSESEYPRANGVRRVARRSQLVRKYGRNGGPFCLEDDYRQRLRSHCRRDEERKSNSPDSLLVKSSESELSSEEYGQTDDSGAFLEKPLNSERKYSAATKLIKFFAKDQAKRSKSAACGAKDAVDFNENSMKGVSKESLSRRCFEYENIPRIDVTKLEGQRGFSRAVTQTPRTSGIEHLREEEEHFRSWGNFGNRREAGRGGRGGAGDEEDEEEEYESRLSCRRLSGLMHDLYEREEIVRSANGDRRLSKMETISEENGDGSKLSVREILKRFEELRTQEQQEQQEQQKQQGQQGQQGQAPQLEDRTLTAIEKTLEKLDEKVKRYQVDQKSIQRSSHHESHVSQIGRSIQSQSANYPLSANHTGNHVQEDLHTAGRQPNHVSLSNYPVNQVKSRKQHLGAKEEWRQPEESARQQDESGIYEGGGPVVNDGKHSLLQYAMLHFRQSTEKFEMLKTADGSISGSLKVIESLKSKKKAKKGKGQQEGAEWTWKEQVDLVKYSAAPISQSLLRLEPELGALAVECFLCLMRYMADQPMPPDMSEVKCVYTILMHCHKYELLRDEVYCQLMKQTTNNKSSNPESCQRGWRIFSIVAAYFTCSDTLKPYLMKYLETAAYDKRRAYHGTATVCLQNLRKTVKYGGRKNVPSVEEIMAISAGRNAKRQIYRLPGGTERVINTKCTTVVQDVIEEMCNIISVGNPHEMDEFSLYCIVDGDAFTMPLARDEYVLDVTTELHKNHQVFYLIFCRSVWYYPLRLDAPLYIEVVFNQIAPDYLEGLLLVLPGEHLPQEVIYDMAQIAALLHRAADMIHEPATKEIKYLLPKPALSLRDPRPQQWSNMVQQAWATIQHNSPAACKAQVLEILSKWPLFGSSFFAVKKIPEGKEKGGEHILALNRHGVHFIDLITHETLYHYPYSEVISTRKVKSEEGTLYLDMKCGNLMQQRITRLQTEQAHEISRLIRQYITMEQRATNSQGMPAGIGYTIR